MNSAQPNVRVCKSDEDGWKPVYFPCENCEKEEHTGWSDDPKEASIKYTKYCSEECYDAVQKREEEWWAELRAMTLEDWDEHKTLDVPGFTRLSIWLADSWLKDEEWAKSVIRSCPLFKFPTELAAEIRSVALRHIPSEYVTIGRARNMFESGTFEFNKPLPVEVAFLALRGMPRREVLAALREGDSNG
jgi:hypothetical protein